MLFCRLDFRRTHVKIIIKCYLVMKKIKVNKENLKYLIRYHWLLIVIELLFAIISGVQCAISSFMPKTFVNNIVNVKSLKVAMNVVAVSIFVLFKNICI